MCYNDLLLYFYFGTEGVYFNFELGTHILAYILYMYKM
jgi:hypothetical protein